MKFRLVLLIATLFCASLSIAQLSTSVYLGVGAAKDLKSNTELTPNVIGDNDYAVKPTRQNMTYTGGVSVDYTFPSHFLIGAELQYQTSSTDYALWNLAGDSEYRPTMTLSETEHRLVLPISVGARIWNFTLTSGVNANLILSKTSELDQFESFQDTDSKMYMGWHAGLAYHIGPAAIEVRYMQDFKNYGSGYELANKDMVFYGNQSRWLFLAKFDLMHWRK